MYIYQYSKYPCLIFVFILIFSCIPNTWSQSKNTVIRYPVSDEIILVKTLQSFMICDTSGQLKTPDELVFDGSILFDYGEWNSSGLPLIFRTWNFSYTHKNGTKISSMQLNDITNVYPFRNRFAMVQRGNHYNFIDTKGTLIGPVWFDYAENFSQGLALVGTGKWIKGFFTGELGFIDSIQRIIIPVRFESAESFSNDYANVWMQGRLYQIDRTGRPLTKFRNTNIVELSLKKLRGQFGNPLYRPEQNELLKYLFISEIDTSALPKPSAKGWDYLVKNKVILHVDYDYAFKFSEGLAKVRNGEKWNYINDKGKLLLMEWVDDADNFKQGLAKIKKDGKTGYIDCEGKYLIPLIYPVKNFSGGKACIEKLGSRFRELTYIDKSGQQIITWMAGATEFVEGRAQIKREDGLYATIDTSGNILETWHYKILFQGDEVDVLECNENFNLRDKRGNLIYNWRPDVSLFFEGFLAIKKGGKWGYVDKYGKPLIKLEYDECWNFKDRLAVVKKDNKFTWIDNNGRNIANDWFESVGDFSDDLAAVMKKGKWGYLNTDGKVAIKFQFQAAANFSEGFALVKKGTKFGYIKKTGKKLTNFEYTAGGNFSNGIALVKKNKISGYIDKYGTFYLK
jgi:hypothetical protein